MKAEEIAYLLRDYAVCESLEGHDLKIAELVKQFAKWSKEMRVLTAKPLYSLSQAGLLREIRKGIAFSVKRGKAIKPKRGWVKFKSRGFDGGVI